MCVHACVCDCVCEPSQPENQFGLWNPCQCPRLRHSDLLGKAATLINGIKAERSHCLTVHVPFIFHASVCRSPRSLWYFLLLKSAATRCQIGWKIPRNLPTWLPKRVFVWGRVACFGILSYFCLPLKVVFILCTHYNDRPRYKVVMLIKLANGLFPTFPCLFVMSLCFKTMPAV